MEQLQEQEWNAMGDALVAVLQQATARNLLSSTIPNLFENNLVWGRAVLARIVVESIKEDVSKAPLLACLVAIVNSKIPDVGKLTIQEAIKEFIEWRKLSRPTDSRKHVCSLIAHLCNQGVCGELLPLEILLVLLEGEKTPVEAFTVAASLVREVGAHLSSRPALKAALDSVFEKFREATHERKDLPHTLVNALNDLQKSRQKKFVMFPVILPEFDLLEEAARVTHELSLDDVEVNTEHNLAQFSLDRRFIERAEAWMQLKHEFLDDVYDQAPAVFFREEIEAPEKDVEENQRAVVVPEVSSSTISSAFTNAPPQAQIIDKSSQDLVAVRKRIYLTINHGLTMEQVAHQLLGQRNKELRGHDDEIVAMIVERCAQDKSYTDFVGLLATRLCRAVPAFPALFEQEFNKQYQGIHRLETNKLRNIAVLYAQLLYAECLSWPVVFQAVTLDEDSTTSSSRIFLKILFQRLVQLMGVDQLKNKLTPYSDFKGLFPTKPPRRTRFAINYLTSIDLGLLTVEMRDWLINGPPDADDDSSSSSSESSSEESSTSSSSSSSDSSSESEVDRKRKHSRRHKRSSSKRRKRERSRRRGRESDDSEGEGRKKRNKRNKRSRDEEPKHIRDSQPVVEADLDEARRNSQGGSQQFKSETSSADNGANGSERAKRRGRSRDASNDEGTRPRRADAEAEGGEVSRDSHHKRRSRVDSDDEHDSARHHDGAKDSRERGDRGERQGAETSRRSKETEGSRRAGRRDRSRSYSPDRSRRGSRRDR